MIIPMLCVTIFVILVVWFLLPRVARLMIHTPTAISIFVCLSMVQLRSEERRVGKECRSRCGPSAKEEKIADNANPAVCNLLYKGRVSFFHRLPAHDNL